MKLQAVKHFYSEGEWLDHDNPDHAVYIGEELTFDDLTTMIGQLVIYTCYTQSRKWLKVIRVHSFTDNTVSKIQDIENGKVFTRSLVFTDGHKDFGRVNEYWFNTTHNGVKAYRLRKRGFFV